jgi:hypothetical protein
MINWKSIIGLFFLIASVAKLYTLYAGNIIGTPVYAEIGCVIWMLVGVYLIIKGITNKAE